jgi:hypothetical protein
MITNKQVKILMKHKATQPLEIAAAKAGMDITTARKYIKSGKLPSELKKPHIWATRKDPFSQHWEMVEEFLRGSETLEAQTMLEYLIEHYPSCYSMSQLRTLQRRFRNWRAEFGKDKAIMFAQLHYPGLQSQSDFTVMNNLNITIAGQPFPHLLFHFMLVYSRWEDVMVCHSESFDNLLLGFEQAVWRLGGLTKEHRTDNLSAAVNNQVTPRKFTERWQQVIKHYRLKATTNNPGVSNENGSVEKSHDLFKKAIAQQLILRGSSDFIAIENYHDFLYTLSTKRNKLRSERVIEEQSTLMALPDDKLSAPKLVDVKVRSGSLVRIDNVPYSVPSRLIGHTLRAKIYPETIALYFSNRPVQSMIRLTSGASVNYIHIIDSLVRKPGAFLHYRYQAALFPNTHFRLAYEKLCLHDVRNGHKIYLKLLQLAKWHGEEHVNCALSLLLESNITPLLEDVKSLLDVPQVIPEVTVKQADLSAYDDLRAIEAEVAA